MSNASNIKSSSDSTLWCLAKYEDEWNRGYVEERLSESIFKVYFIDYGTTSTIRESDIKFVNDDELWLAPALAVPFVIKSKYKKCSMSNASSFSNHIDITPSRQKAFSKMQYSSFNIKSLNLIDKVSKTDLYSHKICINRDFTRFQTCIFEVELQSKTGNDI